MGISASVIVKNEEEVLERMLECVSKWADEIVIVDTGSTDRTVEIAKSHPKVNLFHSQFFNKDTQICDFQFNVAKNEAIDKCREDWICWWDADDFIDDENAARLRSIVENAPEAPALYTFEMQFDGMVFEHCRLFRNGYNIRFDEHHSCHEYLNTLGHPHYHRRDVVIHHRPGKNHGNSAKRNLSILEKDFHERGYDDQRTLFYLANSYRESGNPEEAIVFYDKYLKISQWAEERFFARFYKGGCCRALNLQVDARREYLLCLIEDFRFAEPYVMLGDIALFEGDFDRAEHWYKMALSTPFPKDSRLFAMAQMYDAYPKAQLELVEKNRGRKDIPENPYNVSLNNGKEKDTRPVVKYNLPELLR
jgi:glycosyltransferase involved in cell wall biosynthesis